MKKITGLFLFFMLLFIGNGLAGTVNLITKEELKAELGSGNLVILDVRTGRDWSTSEFKIPGAIRASSNEFDSWSDTYDKGKKFVLYCA